MNTMSAYIKALVAKVDSGTSAEILRLTSTADLQAELSRREGVVTFVLDDEDSDFFYEYHDGGRVIEGAVTGPVTITFKRL